MRFNYIIFISTLLIWFFLLISNNNFLDFPNKVYGHGLSKDESIPIDVSGRQISIEGLISTIVSK